VENINDLNKTGEETESKPQKKEFATKESAVLWSKQCEEMEERTGANIKLQHKAELLEAYKPGILTLFKKNYSAQEIATIISEQQPLKIHAKDIRNITDSTALPKATRRRRKKIDTITGEGCEIQPEPINVTEPQLQEQEAVKHHDGDITLVESQEEVSEIEIHEKDTTQTKNKPGHFTVKPDREI
jgi:hypothetical protein